MPRFVDHDARRDQLCEIVVDLAARDGFAAVTIRAIAAASESSTSSITHYVSSRDELIALAVHRAIAREQARIDAARQGEGLEALHAIASAAVLGTTERERRLWMAIVTGATHDKVLEGELNRFNAWWDELAADLLDQANLAPEAAARFADMLDVVIAGLITTSFEAPHHWTSERRQQTLDGLFAAISPQDDA